MTGFVKRFALRAARLLAAAALVIGIVPTPSAAVQTDAVRYIAHRGYHVQAPENTLPAFAAAAEAGYRFVEADVRFTKDGVAVLCHDATINATARNADGSAISEDAAVRNLTYEELLQYDFGIAAGEAYRGTKIPTFRAWIALCRDLHLTPYIELKSEMTAEQVAALLGIVEAAGMTERVVWIAFPGYLQMLQDVVAAHPEAEVGLLDTALTGTTVSQAKRLQTGKNRVFLDVLNSAVDAPAMALAARAGLEVEVYTVDDAQTAGDLTALGVVGITTNTLRPAASMAA